MVLTFVTNILGATTNSKAAENKRGATSFRKKDYDAFIDLWHSVFPSLISSHALTLTVVRAPELTLQQYLSTFPPP